MPNTGFLFACAHMFVPSCSMKLEFNIFLWFFLQDVIIYCHKIGKSLLVGEK